MMREKIRVILREYLENDEKIEDNSLNQLFNDCVKKIYRAYKELHGQEPDIPEIYLKFDNNFKDGKIGAFVHPENDSDHGVMLIKPKAINDGGEEYVKHIITHELIHAVLGHKNHEHDEHFHRLSDLCGLPHKYRD
jgi:hypothetical protein